MAEFYIYINKYSFEYLADRSYYGDRPELYRQQEKKLWTLNQLIKGGNIITVTNNAKQILYKISDSVEFKSWIEKEYPDFIEQLDEKIYTKYPHPTDRIE